MLRLERIKVAFVGSRADHLHPLAKRLADADLIVGVALGVPFKLFEGFIFEPYPERHERIIALGRGMSSHIFIFS